MCVSVCVNWDKDKKYSMCSAVLCKEQRYRSIDLSIETEIEIQETCT